MSETEKTSLSRRALLQTAAWTVPAVAVAAAAPMASASGDPIIVPTFSPGSFCKHPNAKKYHAVFCFKNTTDGAIVITLDTFTTPNSGIVAGYFSHNDTSVTTYEIPAHTEECLYVDSAEVDNQANGVATLAFHYTYNGDVVNGTVSTDNPPPQGITPCGTNPAQDQPTDAPPHSPDGPPTL